MIFPLARRELRDREMGFLGAGAGEGLLLLLILLVADLQVAAPLECGSWEEVEPTASNNPQHMECNVKTNTWATMPGTSASTTDAECRDWCCAQEGIDINRVEFSTSSGSCGCGLCTENAQKNNRIEEKLYLIPTICAAGSHVGTDGDSCTLCGENTYSAASSRDTSCTDCASGGTSVAGSSECVGGCEEVLTPGATFFAVAAGTHAQVGYSLNPTP